jgi:DNA polymerase (family 10)
MLRFRGESPHRARAYEQGADAVEAIVGGLDRLVEHGCLTDVPGIGRSLAATITELVRDGRAQALDRIMDDDLPPALLALAEVPGFTPRRIRLLHEALDVATADDVRAALQSGVAAEVPGFGATTVERLLAALERAASAPEVTRLVEATTWAERLVSHLAMGAPVHAVEIAGSVRRAVETVSDVNVVASSTRPSEVVAAFASYAGVLEVIDRAFDRCGVRLAGGPVATLTVVAPERFGAALVCATGPPAHVAALEARARARGLQLDEILGEREVDVYAALALPLVPPEVREGNGELDAADAGDAFADLVTLEDLRGAVHCHSLYSDGRDTIEDMAVAAARMGLGYLTMTDHSPAAAYAGGLSSERLAQQQREIEGLGPVLGVRILRGAECDILRNGRLDYDDEVRATLDVIIASIHERHRMDASAMTARLIRGLGERRFKIWGHPLGRLLLRRDPIDCDLPKVLDVLAGSGGAVEINGSPWRLDLPPAFIPQARRRGLKFVISADAHSTDELSYLRWGVAMARRGGLRRADVLNTLEAEAFASAVRISRRW